MKRIITLRLISFFFLLQIHFPGNAQIGTWPMEHITWEIKDCPQFPQYDYWERNCLIKTAEPAGEILIPQGGVDGLNLEKPMWISIPTNRPTWAIGIAHAWNLHRNFIQKTDYPKIGYYMAITGHETGMACDCNAEFMPGHIPWTTTGGGLSNWPSKCGPGARYEDGCFQMEFLNAWGELNQIFPHRFPCTNFEHVVSGTKVPTQVLALSYRNIGYSLLMEYSWNMNPWPIFEDPNCDKYAYEKFLAASWNGSISGTYKTLTQSNVPSPGGWEPDTSKQKANPVHLFENRVNTANNPNWDLDGTVAYYPEVIAWSMAAIEGDSAYAGYRYDPRQFTGAGISTGTGMAGEYDYLGAPIPEGGKIPLNTVNGTYPELQNHVQLGYYNGDIYWTDVDEYIDCITAFYFEFADTTILTPIKDIVRQKFVEISGSVTNPIPFRQLGPVVDEIILAFPKENPLIQMLHLDGIPNGPSGSGHSKCTGEYAPASHIVPVNIQTDTMCTKQTLILKADVVGGDEPNMTYTWFQDGAIVANGVNVEEYAFTPTVAGNYEFNLLICNQAGGCEMASCTYKIQVNECSACNLTAIVSTTNTPCRNTEGGSIHLAVSGSSDYTVYYSGPETGSVVGNGANVSIDNLIDGIYNIRVVDNADTTCFYLTSIEVEYDFYMNDIIDISIGDQRECETDIESEIVKDDCRCDYTVYAQALIPNRWERFMTMKITPSNGRFEIFRANTFDAFAGPLTRKFQLCTGESIKGELSIIPASGSCDTNRTDAVNVQLEAYEVWVVDPEGTEVFRQTYGPGTATQFNDFEMFDITVNCPYSSPFDYTYEWVPSNKTTADITETRNLNGEVLYTVIATNIQHPQCVIRDSAMVPFSCSSACIDPGTVSLDPSGNTPICGNSQLLTASTSFPEPVGGFNYEFFADTGSGPVSIQGPSNLNSVLATYDGAYYVVASDPADPTMCFGTSNIVTLSFFSAPLPANAGTDQNICGDTAALNGNNPSSGSGTWSLISGSGTISNANTPQIQLTNLGTGTNIFEWRISNGSCPSVSDQVSITVSASPDPANAGLDRIICRSDNVNGEAVPVSIGSGYWSVVYGAATFADSTDPQTLLSGFNTGINRLRWTVTGLGACPGSFDEVEITVDELPSVSDAGVDQNYCSGDVMTLSAMAPVIGTGLWSYGTATTGGTIVDPNNENSDISGLNSGEVLQGIWTVSNGVCQSSVDTVLLAVTNSNTPSVAISVSDTIICEGDQITINALPVSAGSSPDIQFLTLGSGAINAVDTVQSISHMPGGATSVYVLLTSHSSCVTGPAQVSSDTVLINVDQVPSAADAGSNITTCSDQVTMNAISPTIGIGQWSLLSGVGTIADHLNPNTQLGALAVGSTTLAWTVTNGACPSNVDSVLISRTSGLTSAQAGNDISICEAAGSVTLNANSSQPNESAHWSSSGDGSFTDSLNPVSDYNPGSTDIINGNVILFWNIQDSLCGTSVDSIQLNIDRFVNSDAGPDQLNLCADNAILNALGGPIGQGTWNILNGPGAISTGDLNNPGATLNGLSGITTLTWQITNGLCIAEPDTVIISSINAVSPSFSILSQAGAYCVGDSFNIQTISSSAGSLPVFIFSSFGNLLQQSNSGTYSIDSVYDGLEIIVSMIPDQTCITGDSLLTDSITLYADEPKTIHINATSLSACEVTTLSVITNANGFGWYSVNNGLLGSNMSSLDVTNSDTYYAVADDSVCGAIVSDSLAVTIDRMPIISMGKNLELMKGDQITIVATAHPFISAVWTDPNGEFSDQTILNPVFTALTPGINTYGLTVFNGACQSSEDLKIEVKTPILIPNAFTPNADGQNDVWLIDGLSTAQNAKLQVYNRWGTPVYESVGTIIPWDGTRNGNPMPIGTYYFVLLVGEVDYNGSVTIVR